jgi:hypothetical protein
MCGPCICLGTTILWRTVIIYKVCSISIVFIQYFKVYFHSFKSFIICNLKSCVCSISCFFSHSFRNSLRSCIRSVDEMTKELAIRLSGCRGLSRGSCRARRVRPDVRTCGRPFTPPISHSFELPSLICAKDGTLRAMPTFIGPTWCSLGWVSVTPPIHQISPFPVDLVTVTTLRLGQKMVTFRAGPVLLGPTRVFVQRSFSSPLSTKFQLARSISSVTDGAFAGCRVAESSEWNIISRFASSSGSQRVFPDETFDPAARKPRNGFLSNKH